MEEGCFNEESQTSKYPPIKHFYIFRYVNEFIRNIQIFSTLPTLNFQMVSIIWKTHITHKSWIDSFNFWHFLYLFLTSYSVFELNNFFLNFNTTKSEENKSQWMQMNYISVFLLIDEMSSKTCTKISLLDFSVYFFMHFSWVKVKEHCTNKEWLFVKQSPSHI